MQNEKLSAENETLKNIVFAPPAVELLLDPDQLDKVWPPEVAQNEQFREQVKKRQLLNQRLNSVTGKLPHPDMSLQEAVAQKFVDEEQVARLYDSLSDLLSNPDYRRAALYTPFEFLPSTDWKPTTATLAQSADAFRESYMKAWHSLLKTQDVRANFVDGDIVELRVREGDLPRVVKAAHLIPKLIESGLLKPVEAVQLFESSENPVLKKSAAEGLVVATDLGLVSESDLTRTDALSLASKVEVAQQKGVTSGRTAWLEKEQQRKAIEVSADKIALLIGQNGALPEDLIQNQQAFASGIGKAIEVATRSNQEQGKALYAKYKQPLLSLWRRGDSEVQESLTVTLSRLYTLGVVSDEQLVELGITIPSLAGPFSRNAEAMKMEMLEIGDITKSIESDPELSKYIYPVTLVFGSRLKGYGSQRADVDIAVFVKPGVPFSEKGKLRELLLKKFPGEKMHGGTTEFWLTGSEENPTILDFAKEDDARLGESYWTHVLFGAAWEGDESKIKELREKLLVPYFFRTNKTFYGHEAHSFYLEELERDNLQYRLMHKGYARIFPPYGGIESPRANVIDNKSMFYDSGYRQTALKLFVDRVFLPKI